VSLVVVIAQKAHFIIGRTWGKLVIKITSVKIAEHWSKQKMSLVVVVALKLHFTIGRTWGKREIIPINVGIVEH
jgi:hypothetical protein